jgi:pyruvate dehydrogenase E1 component alpha subunit
MPKQKISEYLQNAFVDSPAEIQQEIERYTAKEAK